MSFESGNPPATQIDLFQGWPAISMLPVDRLKKAANDALSNETIFATGLEYGPNEGHYPLRENIANWLSKSYAPPQPVSVDRVCVTGGASQNLACVLQVFTDPAQTKMIWLVEPTYHLGFRIFEDAGFMGRLRGIPEDEEGLDVAALEAALREFELRESSVCQDSKVRIKACSRGQGLTSTQDIQDREASWQDLQTCHLLCSNIRQPVRKDNASHSA